MEPDDPQTAARCQAGDGLGQGGLQGLQLIIDCDAQGLEGPGCWVDALAVAGATHCCYELISGLQDFLLARCHNPAHKAEWAEWQFDQLSAKQLMLQRHIWLFPGL